MSISVIPSPVGMRVPTQGEFEYLWWVVKQLYEEPTIEDRKPHEIIRQFHDAVRIIESQIGLVDGNRQGGTLWDSIRNLERNVCWEKDERERRCAIQERLSNVENQLRELPETVKEVLREVIHEVFETHLRAAEGNIGKILEDNRKLREEIDDLRNQLDVLKAKSHS